MEQDRIEIVSFPGPDRSVTMEGLKSFRVSNHRYRNRRIGDFLKELHLTEGRNTGFKKILDALAENGSPEPEFETDEDHSYFITRLFIQEEFLKGNGVESTPSAEKLAEKSAEKKRLILELLEDGREYSAKEIAEHLGLKGSRTRQLLNELVEAGLLDSTAATKNRRYIKTC